MIRYEVCSALCLSLWTSIDGETVKPEPGTTSDAMDIDGKQAKAVQPKAKTSISVAHEESSTQDEKAETDEPRLIRRHKVSTKDAKPVLQTEEDRQESNRHQRDVKLLSEELGQIHTSGQPTSRVDSEGDSSMVIYTIRLDLSIS